MNKFTKWLNKEDKSDPFYASVKNWQALLFWTIMVGTVAAALVALLIFCPGCCITEPSYVVVEREGYFMIESRRYSMRLEHCKWKDRRKADLMCAMLIRMEKRRQ